MAGRKEKGLAPDAVLKHYWNGNEEFADLFNAVLFEGREIIKPGELETADTEQSTVLKQRKAVESIKVSRDVIKICKKSTMQGVQLVLLGLEAQEHVHYAMPLRVMGYDYVSYKKQYDGNARKYRAGKDKAGKDKTGEAGAGTDGVEKDKTEKDKADIRLSEDEFLSRMKKEDRFMPVITIVIYYGEKLWDGATSLHEMLDIPPEVEPYVNDYHMILVEARNHNLKFHNMNNQDLFQLFAILLDQNKPAKEIREQAVTYAREHDVDETVLMTVAGAAHCRIDQDMLKEEGRTDMWSVFEEVAKEGEERGEACGIAKGEARGIAKGKAAGIIDTCHELGIPDEDILTRLQSKLNISVQAAQEYLQMFGQTGVKREI